LEAPVLAGEVLDAVLEGGVLGAQLLDGLTGDHLVEVAELAHDFADPLPLGKDLLLGAGQLGLGVQGPLTPGCFDPVVLFLAETVVSAVAGVSVLVEECGRDPGSLGDGPDGQASPFASELADGLLDLGELVLGLLPAGCDGGPGGVGSGAHAALLVSSRASSWARNAVLQTRPK
jgi:hypothetical protein